ncbi:hypothetical protein [Gordonia mangrovi]|nr:hypothetical protein [Gordonia mangrovi]UVF80939.1 hypothetical protein NWF22_13330 [Gordonia mangrovi]
MQVNIWDQLDGVEELIRSGVVVDESKLADPDVALADLLAT